MDLWNNALTSISEKHLGSSSDRSSDWPLGTIVRKVDLDPLLQFFMNTFCRLEVVQASIFHRVVGVVYTISFHQYKCWKK